MNAFLNFIKRYLAIFIALSTFVALIFGSFRYSNYRQGVWEKDIRAELQENLIGKKSSLEKALYSRIYYTRGVAAYVSMHPNIAEGEYAKLAHEFIKNDSVISTMALSKGGILTYIYPKEGHESAIGLDLLEHPERRQIVEQTIKTHETFVAGPVELVEGGVAFISYTPIFNEVSDKDNDFWGVTDIVILKKALLDEAGLKASDEKYLYALKGYNGKGSEGDFFWGEEKVFDSNPVNISIELPTGSWVLAAMPVNGWSDYLDQDKTLFSILIISSLIISILLWLFANALLQIRKNERELTAIFRSLNGLVIEFNKKGEYVKIAPTNHTLLYKPEKELLGKSLYDILDSAIAKQIHDAILKCLAKKETLSVSYPLEIEGKLHWFQAQLSHKSDSTVIFNAIDISELKNHEAKILKTRNELAETVAMKDKLFSIIAHDLRGPVGSYRSLTDIILKNYSDISDEERIELIEQMRTSSDEISNLLENLLTWANTQSNRITIDKKEHLLKDLVDAVVPAFANNASQKNVRIEKHIQQGLSACFDMNATKTVLRNLISNALKFSLENGHIEISAEENENEVAVSVKDSGVGIDPKQLNTLFQMDVSNSTPGTKGEKGTGLGLILCKEFVEKQGGKIRVESSKKGTTILFTIPK